jgi:hypothetical protein
MSGAVSLSPKALADSPEGSSFYRQLQTSGSLFDFPDVLIEKNAAPQDDAIVVGGGAVYQREVLNCRDASCFQSRIGVHALNAEKFERLAYAELPKNIRLEVLLACKGSREPAFSACVSEVLDGLRDTGGYVARTGAGDFSGKITQEGIAGTNFAKLATGLCGGTGSAFESCLERVSKQIYESSTKAGTSLAKARKHLDAISVQSRLCERGGNELAEEIKKENPKLAAQLIAFGEEACGRVKLTARLNTLDRMAIAYSPSLGRSAATVLLFEESAQLGEQLTRGATLEKIRRHYDKEEIDRLIKEFKKSDGELKKRPPQNGEEMHQLQKAF